MHAGTEAEYTDQLIRPTSVTGNDIIPTILLESTDKLNYIKLSHY